VLRPCDSAPRVACGALYVVIGLFGAAVTGLLLALPRELVLAIAGIALWGVGSAFWDVVDGAIALLVQQYGIRKTDRP